MKSLEADEQAALFEWAAYIPELRWMHASLNGVFLHGNKIQRAIQWAKQLKQGAKKGIWDIFLPLPRGDYHGLYIEMKASTKKNHLTEDQSEFGAFAMNQGYYCAVCYGTEEAINTIKEYLKL